MLLKLKTSEYIEVGWLLHKLSLQVFAAIRLFAFLPQSFLWPVLKASPEAPSVPQLDTSTQNVPQCATSTLPHFHPRSHSEVCHTLPHTEQCYTPIHSVPHTSSTSSRPCLLLPLLKAFKSFAPAPLYQRPKCRPNFKLQLLRNRNPSPSNSLQDVSEYHLGTWSKSRTGDGRLLMEDRLLGGCKKLICG